MSTWNYLCYTCVNFERDKEGCCCKAFPQGIPDNHDCFCLVSIDGEVIGNGKIPTDCGNGYRYMVHPDTVKYREEWKRDKEAGISMAM